MIQAFSDNLIFSALKLIKHGHLELINFDGKKYNFGEKDKNLNVFLQINKPGFTFNVIRKGSIGGHCGC